MEQYFFYPLALIVLFASIRVVLGRNAIHSALWLVLVFFCFGGLYLLLHAEFLAAVQVIVYAGAIMVLFLFVIMLLRVDRPEDSFSRQRIQKIIGIVLTIAMVLGIGITVYLTTLPGQRGSQSVEAIAAQEGGNTAAIAELIFTDYLLPFEATSVLLLAALVGAVVLTKKRREEKK